MCPNLAHYLLYLWSDELQIHEKCTLYALKHIEKVHYH